MSDQTDDLVISISTDMTAVKRALTKLGADVGAASADISRKFDKVGASLDNSITTALQARVNSMVGVGTKAANEWSGALADQGKQLDALRAKYNPLFSTIKQYQDAQSNIKTLYASGTIGADEYSAAMSRQRQAALSTIAAIKSQGAAVTVSSAAARSAGHGGGGDLDTTRLLALGHAARSVTEQLALGVPVTQALAGQIGHLSYVASGPGGVTGALKEIGDGAISIIGKFPLVSAGIALAAAGALVYYTLIRTKTKDANDILKEHADLIGTIKGRYGDAAKGISEYAAKSEAQDLADVQQKLKDAQEFNSKLSSSTVHNALGLSATDFAGPIDTITAFRKSINDLQAGVKAGNPDFAAFQEQMAKIESSDGASEIQKKLAHALGDTDEETQKVISSIPGLVDSLKAIGGAAGDQIDRVASLSSELTKLAGLATSAGTFSDQGSAAVNAGMSKLNEFRGNSVINEEGRRRLLIAQSLADQRNDAGFVDTGNGYRVPAPTPEARPNIELEGLPGEVKADDAAAKKAASAAAELKKKQDDLLRTTADRIDQQQQEITLAGKYGVAADNARMALETWQKAEKLNLNDDQKKALQEKIDQYAKLSDTLAKVKLNSDLADENRIAGLSTRDQAIVEKQKQYGLPTDPNSAQGRQIGQSVDQKELAGGISSFFTDIEGGLMTKGKKIGEVLGDAVKDSLQSAMKKTLDSLFSQLGNGIASLLTGGKSGGATGIGSAATSVAGSIFGKAGGVSSTGSAVDKASALLGKNENTNTGDINSFLKAGGVDINAAQTAWCAGFVNSSLAQVGVKGSGSLTANSFLNWGTKIDPSQVMKGDVLVQNRGLGADQMGGHVGLATGETRMSGGVPQLQMLSGNSSNAVSDTWVNSMDVQARRATDASDSLAKLTASSGDATKGLGTLGSSLSTAFPAAPAASGGGSSWLSSLFGSVFKPNGAQATLAASGGVGLYADGGHVTGPGSPTSDSIPTMLSNGEFVINAASTKKHRALIESINAGKVQHLASGGLVTPQMVSAPTGPSLMPRAGSTATASQPGILQVHISGASGDDHVRALVKQGVGDGLTQYGQQQRRGGFGDTQNRWTNQKG